LGFPIPGVSGTLLCIFERYAIQMTEVLLLLLMMMMRQHHLRRAVLLIFWRSASTGAYIVSVL